VRLRRPAPPADCPATATDLQRHRFSSAAVEWRRWTPGLGCQDSPDGHVAADCHQCLFHLRFHLASGAINLAFLREGIRLNFTWGEPYLVSKTVGAGVLSGAVNGDSALTLTTTALPKDSRYMRIMQVMQEADVNRPRFRRIADRVGGGHIPLAGWRGYSRLDCRA